MYDWGVQATRGLLTLLEDAGLRARLLLAGRAREEAQAWALGAHGFLCGPLRADLLTQAVREQVRAYRRDTGSDASFVGPSSITSDWGSCCSRFRGISDWVLNTVLPGATSGDQIRPSSVVTV